MQQAQACETIWNMKPSLHQAGGGQAETEEQADPRLLRGLESGAAVLAITRVKTLSGARQQHGAGHADQQGSLLEPLPTKRSGSPKMTSAMGAQDGHPTGRGS